MHTVYLKKSVRVLPVIAILGGGISMICQVYAQVLRKERKQKEKNRAILKMFSKWIQNKEEGKNIETYLKELGVQRIAIYGMSDAGQRLYEELKGSSINIEYVIDKRSIEIKDDISIVTMDDALQEVDLIIVTAIFDYPEIVDVLKNKTQYQIISLEQIIYEL